MHFYNLVCPKCLLVMCPKKTLLHILHILHIHTHTHIFLTTFFLTLRLSTASIRWEFTVWLWCPLTHYPKLLWAASTFQRPNSASWREPFTPATSSCALIPASPTCPNQDRSSRVQVSVGWLFFILCIFCTSYNLLSLLFQRWVLLL